VQADDAAEDEAGRLDAKGESRSPGRTAEREAQSTVQAIGGDEREADRLGEGASWKHNREADPDEGIVGESVAELQRMVTRAGLTRERRAKCDGWAGRGDNRWFRSWLEG